MSLCRVKFVYVIVTVQGEVQLYHTQAEMREKGFDQHELLKMLKDKGAEFVYDDVNDDDNDDEEDDGSGETDDDEFDEDLPSRYQK